MKALHEFKTEQLYKDYLVIYFAGQFVSSGKIPDTITIEIVTQLVDKLPMNRPKVIRSEKEIKPILERKKDFAMSIQPYLDKYGKKMLNEFYAYWTEETQGKDKLRVELQKTWNVERRLSTWNENNSSFTKTPTLNNLQGTI